MYTNEESQSTFKVKLALRTLAAVAADSFVHVILRRFGELVRHF
jgi:hypothetical protein